MLHCVASLPIIRPFLNDVIKSLDFFDELCRRVNDFHCPFNNTLTSKNQFIQAECLFTQGSGCHSLNHRRQCLKGNWCHAFMQNFIISHMKNSRPPELNVSPSKNNIMTQMLSLLASWPWPLLQLFEQKNLNFKFDGYTFS